MDEATYLLPGAAAPHGPLRLHDLHALWRDGRLAGGTRVVEQQTRRQFPAHALRFTNYRTLRPHGAAARVFLPD